MGYNKYPKEAHAEVRSNQALIVMVSQLSGISDTMRDIASSLISDLKAYIYDASIAPDADVHDLRLFEIQTQLRQAQELIFYSKRQVEELQNMIDSSLEEEA